MSKDKEAQAEFQRKKNMFLFLGHLKASIEMFESLADGGEFQEEVCEINNGIWTHFTFQHVLDKP